MATDVTFQLDISAAGKEILQDLVMDTIKQAGTAIADRANGMAASSSVSPPEFHVFMSIGKIKIGRRAIATVKANTANAHQSYIAKTLLAKAKDAGRPR